MRPAKPTTPASDIRLLARHLRHKAIDVAEESLLWRDRIAEIPGAMALVGKIIDYEAAVEAYRKAHEP